MAELKRKYKIHCNECGTNIEYSSRQTAIEFGMKHGENTEHKHNPKLMTYEVREVLIQEQYLF